MSLTISFDFDGTFAADPDTWKAVVVMLQQAGHTCVLCTNRPPEWGEEVRKLVAGCMPIVFAGMGSKYNMMIKAGYRVDVWIDDMPDYVMQEGLRFRGSA